MKRIILLLTFILFAASSFARDVYFDFPEFSGETLKLYFFKGSRVDSLQIVLDEKGKGETNMPLLSMDADVFQAYKGMVQLFIIGGGAAEFIAGEENLQVVCKESSINRETMSFPNSKENVFLYTQFIRKSQLMELQGWLQAGERFFTDNKKMRKTIAKQAANAIKELTLLDNTVKTSPLYAARFMQWADFMNRLYEAEQQRDQGKAGLIREEMETTADIASLFTAGELWGSVHNFYISMFNRLDTPRKQEDYASSINKTAQRLTGSVLEGFYVSAINECERFGWQTALEVIVKNIARVHPQMEFRDSNLRRLVGMYHTLPGSFAPELVINGKVIPFTEGKKLVVFYESGCNSCDILIGQLKDNYSLLLEKGFQIITLAADHDKNVYEFHAQSYLWPNNFCDYEGFEGPNFKNYGVIATPTIYTISEEGKILGRYASLEETGVVKD